MYILKSISLIAVFSLGIGGGVIVSKYIGKLNPHQGSEATAERQPLYWVAPMDKSFRSDKPGKSPMGMDLIPVYADEETVGDDRNLVQINPTIENNIGVRTAFVSTSRVSPKIETVGTIQIDDDNMSVVDVRTEGWIENMPVKAIGDKVKKGQLLFQIYSRPLVSAQDEYLQAVKMGRENLISATNLRLVSLGMSKPAIQNLHKHKQSIRLINIYAPRSGIVTEMGASEGGFVKPGMNILKIVDLKTVWAIADVFEDQVHQIYPDQNVSIHISGMPEREWIGKVEYIYPTVNTKARTVPVRIRLDNREGILRPGMFVHLSILTDKNMPVMDMPHTMVIPREALIRTGRTERVMLALGKGKYQPAKVVSGQEVGDDIEILSGLSMGDRVVISSQFLIDSEASLQGTMLRLSPNEPEMESMDMESPAEKSEKSQKKNQKSSEVQGMGTVISLMQKHGMITIKHEPIQALSWPSMTMPFITDPSFLKGIKKGDHVHITILREPDESGNYKLSKIENMDMESPAEKLEKSQKKNQKSGEVQGMGTVISLMQKHGMITIKHEPIQALSWPSMTMPFITDPSFLKGIKKGDHVHITILREPDESGNYKLSKIKKMDMESPAEKLEKSQKKNQKSGEVQGMGTVISLMQKHGMITIKHEPIQALSWPSMTMPFITDPSFLKGIKKGDHVHITILREPDESGNYKLSKIKKMDMNKGSK